LAAASGSRTITKTGKAEPGVARRCGTAFFVCGGKLSRSAFTKSIPEALSRAVRQLRRLKDFEAYIIQDTECPQKRRETTRILPAKPLAKKVEKKIEKRSKTLDKEIRCGIIQSEADCFRKSRASTGRERKGDGDEKQES
jgi:hypothetical protein